MAFDINEVVAEMLGAIKTTAKKDWDSIKGTASSYLQDRKLRLDLLTSLVLHKEIDREFFIKRTAIRMDKNRF